jgi:hypothetical protein
MEKQTKPDALDRALTNLYRSDIPDGYRVAWRDAVKREEQKAMKPTPKRRAFLRVALPLAAALTLLAGTLTAGNLIPTVLGNAPASVSAAKKTTADTATYGASDNAVVYSAAPALGMSADESTASGGTARDLATDSGAQNTDDTTAVTGTKIVRTANLTIATSTFDVDTQTLTDLVKNLGGYIASVSAYGEASENMDRVAYYDLRIPSGQLDAFLAGAESIGIITSRGETATDMTTQYSDTQMRLTTQQEKMTRLQQLLTQASDVSDLLEIENEIANTQYTLDSLETSLRTIDRDVDNSDVSVTLQEQSAGDAAKATELTLWQRLGSGFQASIEGLSRFFQNMLVFLAMALPVLVPLTVAGLAAWLIIRARRKHRIARDSANTSGETEPVTHKTNR